MNARKLKAAMVLCDVSGNEMAKRLGMTAGSFSAKMHGSERANGNNAEFTQSEIAQIKAILNLGDDDIIAIFFDTKSS